MEYGGISPDFTMDVHKNHSKNIKSFFFPANLGDSSVFLDFQNDHLNIKNLLVSFNLLPHPSPLCVILGMLGIQLRVS